eukprot:352149-Chlamydomonas_euryale.AAC.13
MRLHGAARSTYFIAGCMGCMRDMESQAALAGRGMSLRGLRDCPAAEFAVRDAGCPRQRDAGCPSRVSACLN